MRWVVLATIVLFLLACIIGLLLVAIDSFAKWTRSNELILQELRISNRPFFCGPSAQSHVASFTFEDPDPV